MKKSKIIASALIVATVAMGTGYAAWNDTLNINSTASTGNLNVEFLTANSSYPLELHPYAFNLELANPGYLEKGLSFNKDEVNVTLNNLYPGTGMLYAAQFKNKGSIPVIIEKVEVQIPNDPFSNLMKNNLIVVGGFVQTGSSNTHGIGMFPEIKFFKPLPKEKNYQLKDLQANLNTMLQGRKMMPGDVISLDLPDQASKDAVADLLTSEQIEGFNPNDSEKNCIIMGLPKGVGNELMSKNLTTDQYEKKSLSFKIIFHFKQFNN